jgi:hypothetical protein
MGAYDSPGHSSPLFGAGDGTDRYGAGAGSAEDHPPRDLRQVVTGLPGQGSIVAMLGPADGGSDLQPGQLATYGPGGREPFTQVGNGEDSTFPGPGDPSSHVSTPAHVNSLGLPR